MNRAPDTLEALRAGTKPGHPWYGPDEALGPCWEGDAGLVATGIAAIGTGSPAWGARFR